MPSNWSHPAALEDQALLADCTIQNTKGSGPGGQRRNKVETAVIVTHTPTGVSGQASEMRHREQNRRRAVRRLRLALATQHRTPTTLDAHPTAMWRSRCRGGRVAINPEHTDYPSLLAEALDLLALMQLDMSAVAEHLGCTATQLLKLIKAGPAEGLIDLNKQRQQAGLRPLR